MKNRESMQINAILGFSFGLHFTEGISGVVFLSLLNKQMNGII